MHGWEGGESSFVSLLSLFLFVSSLLWFVPVLMLPSVFAPRCWVLLPWWVPLCRLVVLMGGFLPKVVLFLVSIAPFRLLLAMCDFGKKNWLFLYVAVCFQIRVLIRRGGNARHGKISVVGSALYSSSGGCFLC